MSETMARKELPVSCAPTDGRRVLLRAGSLYMAAVWNADRERWMEPEGCCEIARKPTHYVSPGSARKGRDHDAR